VFALLPALAACAGVVLGAPGPDAQDVRWRASAALQDFVLRLERTGEGEFDVAGPPRREGDAPPACLGDVCQPAVAIPGMEPIFGRVHRTELVLALLDRANVEPLATITWALVATGVRFDYTPQALDARPSSGGWGSVFVRLRLRLDADNVPTLPSRSAGRARPRA
jgi:hypothetical protein